MSFTENWNRYVAFKAQSGKGAQASGGSAQVLWVTGGAGGLLTKASIESQLVRRDGQQFRGRHGSRRTAGTYSSEFGLGRADTIMAAIFRGSFGSADFSQSNVNFTSMTTGANTIVLASGNPITQGFRVGDVIRLTNHAQAGNNNRNLRITALSATTITVAETLTVDASADNSFTITRPGRVLVNPAAGALTKTYFTVEEHEYDQDASELFTDCVWSRMMLSMQADGMLMTEFGWTGTGAQSTVSGVSAPHFTSPTEPTSLSFAAAEAVIRSGSADVAALTSFDLTVELQPDAPATISRDGIAPDVFLGTFRPSLNMTFLREDLQALADLSAETRLSLHALFEADGTNPKGFLSVYIPNMTLGSVAKSAMSKAGGASTVTVGVPAELIGQDTTGGAFDVTTMKIQVSNAS